MNQFQGNATKVPVIGFFSTIDLGPGMQVVRSEFFGARARVR